MVRNKKDLKSRIDSYANSAMGKNLEAELAEKEKKNSILSRLSGFISKISSEEDSVNYSSRNSDGQV